MFLMSKAEVTWERVTEEVEKVWGFTGLYRLTVLRRRNARSSPEEILQVVRADPTSRATCYWRDPNLRVFTEQAARPLMERLGRTRLNIGHIACADGSETLTLAARLAKESIPATIRAFDIHRQSIEKARTFQYPENAVSPAPEGEADLLTFFGQPDTEGTVTPRNIDAVRSTVTYTQHDILTGPPPGGPYDVIVCNNLLYHLTETYRNRAVANMLSTLVTHGLFIFETPGQLEYTRWTQTLEQRFGLIPTPHVTLPDQVRTYNPDAIDPPKLAPPPSNEDAIALPSGGSLLQQMGARALNAVNSLPFASAQHAVDRFGEARATLTQVAVASAELPVVHDMLIAGAEHAIQSNAAMMAARLSVYEYIQSIGLPVGHTHGADGEPTLAQQSP
jgi:chemotaxis methyl-accepting protein methylase